ncbi:MAG: hypothetical protein D3910_22695 [Candidatus Electrothrix sp. ATG2]|nr:hypothetical protein [Candidatus Electrothrix sp. ATG2]
MQGKRKKNMGKVTAAILLTGCFMLTTGHGVMAQESKSNPETTPPKVKLDFDKIQQTLKQDNTASGGTAAQASSMQVKPAMTGNTGRETPQARGEAMRKKNLSSDVMAELGFAKKRPTSNNGNTASDKTAIPAPAASTGQMPATSAAPTVNGMQVGPAMMGTMGGSLISSDMMAEMQKKVMAENMKSIQESVQASIMESMKGAAQQTTKETKPE